MPNDDTVGKGGWGVKMSLKVMTSYLDVPLRHYAKLGAFSVIVKSSRTFVWSSILVPVAGPRPGRGRGEGPEHRPRLLPRAARAPGRGLDLGPAHTRPRLAPGQQGHQGDVLLSPGVQTQVRSWGLIVRMRSCPLTHTHLTFLIKAVYPWINVSSTKFDTMLDAVPCTMPPWTMRRWLIIYSGL